ncbi:hypothetical protein [Streptomyces sp. NPDC051214]|uniref:hypothetical protein n=1 Tax=Streptomyces sp. NPDC051214 TaxID=3155282 RepID=UPI0034413638
MALATATLTAGALGASAAADAGTGPRISHTEDIARWTQAHPAPPEQQGAPVPRGELAKSGSDSDTMLYAGLAISLCALGALAVAAARSRRD